jgi:hypothetical protein
VAQTLLHIGFRGRLDHVARAPSVLLVLNDARRREQLFPDVGVAALVDRQARESVAECGKTFGPLVVVLVLARVGVGLRAVFESVDVRVGLLEVVSEPRPFADRVDRDWW